MYSSLAYLSVCCIHVLAEAYVLARCVHTYIHTRHYVHAHLRNRLKVS